MLKANGGFEWEKEEGHDSHWAHTGHYSKETVTGQHRPLKIQSLGQHRQSQQTVTGPTQATKETVTSATKTNSTGSHWAHTGH
jgi:hypothetical protein